MRTCTLYICVSMTTKQMIIYLVLLYLHGLLIVIISLQYASCSLCLLKLQTSPKFMGQLADFLLSRDCPNLTLRVCDIHANSDSDDSEGYVMAAKLRALGMLKRLTTAQDLYNKVYCMFEKFTCNGISRF